MFSTLESHNVQQVEAAHSEGDGGSNMQAVDSQTRDDNNHSDRDHIGAAAEENAEVAEHSDKEEEARDEYGGEHDVEDSRQEVHVGSDEHEEAQQNAGKAIPLVQAEVETTEDRKEDQNSMSW